MKTIELLAPAGSIEAVYQAVYNGAEAVYMGGKSFGARAYANNFSYNEMKKAIDFAHLYGVRIYVTVNTLIYQSEIDEFLEHVKIVYQLGADALIMQDIGMITQVKQRFPDIEIHASTQMHNHNDDCLYFVREMGACRAVLAREMSLKQIQNLTCEIEKEVFIHGALCICYSGECLFSSLTKQRSGNRGKCAQNCRMKYRLFDDSGNQIKCNGKYILSPKDLGLLEDIDTLIDAGVDSLKIEGRMKSPEYVGHVTKIYAKMIKSAVQTRSLRISDSELSDLKKLFNRGFTKGHLFQNINDDLMSIQRPNHKGIPIGHVVDIRRDKIIIKLFRELSQGDGIKFETSDTGFICNKVYKNRKLVYCANAGDEIALDNKVRVRRGESVVKTSDAQLIKRLQEYSKRKINITGKIIAKVDQSLVFQLCDDLGHSVSVVGDIVQKSKTRPTTKIDIQTNISKMGDTPFKLQSLEINYGQDIFVAKSQINALRRKAADALIEKRTSTVPRRVLSYTPKSVTYEQLQEKSRLHVLVRNEEQLNAVKDLVTGDIYTNSSLIYANNKDGRLRLKINKLAKSNVSHSGEQLLVTDHGGIHAYHSDNNIVIDYSLGVLNAESLSVLVEYGVKRITLSPELNNQQIKELITAYQKRNNHVPVLEAPVYVRYELMAMQHCVIAHSMNKKKHCDLCKHKQYHLQDISGNEYPILTDEYCNNYIFSRLYNRQDISVLKEMGIRHFRIELLNETGQEARQIVKRFLDQIGD